jgi:thiamine-phosphate pyrophosphorylase
VIPGLPRLVVITDWSMGERALLAALDEVLPLGEAVSVQHRHPTATAREFLREARLLAERCERFAVPLFVNARLDVALLVGAHLHLPSRGPDVRDVRRFLPRTRWISAAVHAEDEAVRARGADLALVSPVFPAGSKPNDTRAPIGPDGFARLSRRLECPAFALGGVDPARARQLPPKATAGVAVISAVLHAQRPAEAAQALLASLPAQC